MSCIAGRVLGEDLLRLGIDIDGDGQSSHVGHFYKMHLRYKEGQN